MPIDPHDVLSPFNPSRDALFVRCSRHLTDDPLDTLTLSDMANEDDFQTDILLERKGSAKQLITGVHLEASHHSVRRSETSR